MLKSHVTLALRSLRKHPLYTFINLLGLSVGIAVAFVLGLHVRHELTYDRAFDAHDRIFRVTTDFYGMGGFAKSQSQLLDYLPAAAPLIEYATRFDRGFQSTTVDVDGRVFELDHFFYVDSSFFDVFSYDFAAGDRRTAMLGPNEAVMTEALARMYFGSTGAAIGRTILVGKDREAYRVTSVVADPPTPTHLETDLWLPLPAAEPTTGWTNISLYNYVRLQEGGTRADVERALDALLRDRAWPASQSGESFEAWAASSAGVHFEVQALTDIYLRSAYRLEIAPGGNPTQVYILAVIALITLFIAGVNYVNLSTARSTIRALEVGIRRSMGAGSGALIRQFLVEAVVYSLLAFFVAAALVEALLDGFTIITGSVLTDSLFGETGLVAALFGFAVLVGVLAGLYPAIHLAGFRPIEILGRGRAAAGTQRLRGALVVLQFAITTALIIGGVVVYQQLAFMQRGDKGFEYEGGLVVENARLLGEQAEAFRQELAQLPGVANSAFASITPTESGIWVSNYQTPEMGEPVTIQTFPGDANVIPTLGLRLIAGRNFSDELASDSSAAIVNEAAIRLLGLGDEPLGKEINDGQRVIGVVQDFHFASFRQAIEPVVLSYDETRLKLLLKLDASGVGSFVERLTSLWKEFLPDEAIRYAFIEDNFARMVEQERTLSRAITFFTAVALLIACLGLLGLTTFAVERRTKEIGLRKALGASVGSLVATLSKDFVRLIFLAFLVAAPIAWLAMTRWLNEFAYRIGLSGWTFVAVGMVVLVVAVLTVSYQAMRAALANPVKSLRYE